MTRRDVQMVADVLRSFGGRSIRPTTIARAIADELERRDGRFNRRMFLIESGTRRRSTTKPRK